MTTKNTILKAIRAKCLDCSYDQPSEVKLCPDTNCALYPFRSGKDPNPRTLSDAEKASRTAALSAARSTKN